MGENDYRIKAFEKKNKYWWNQIEGKILVKSNRRENIGEIK